MNQTFVQRQTPCPLCSGIQALPSYRTGDGMYLQCARCGLVSVDPIPSPAQMLARAEFWSKEHHQSAEKIAAHYSAAFQRVAFSDFLRRFEVYRQQGRILDLGCGIGGFIHAAQQAGWEAYGVDISPSVEVARSRGLRVFQGTIEQANFADSFFDVVTLFDVIEHIPDPRQMILQAVRVLRPGGCLFLLTPNQGSLLAKLLGERWEIVEPQDHLALFNRGAVTTLLVEAGCEIARVQAIDLNILELRRIFNRQKNLENRIEGQKRRRAFVNSFVKIPFMPFLRRVANTGLTLTGLGDKLVVESIYLPGKGSSAR